MLKTLKNYQIMDLAEAFKRIAKMNIVSTKKFSYALILNDEVIQSNVKAITTIASPSESYLEYETKRHEIISKYAEVDGDGNIILNDNRWVTFKEGTTELATDEVKLLNEEYADVIELRNADIDQYNELLDSDVQLNIQMVDIDDVPDEVGKDLFLTKLLMTMID